MPEITQSIRKEQVRDLLESGAQLVEVLSAEAYAKLHIAGAISLPLENLDRETASRLDPHRPIITYCADYQ